MTKIGIVTVSYNGAKDTLELLESLKKLKLDDLETKTIVVDNGSTDDSFEKLLKLNNIDLLQTGFNKGFTGGYNKGIDYALAWGADFVLIINNDAIINSSNLISHLLQTQKKEPKIGVVAPKILFAPGYEFHQDRYSKDQIGKVIWYGGGEFDWDNVMGKHLGIDGVDQGQFDQVKQTPYVSGCCLLLSQEFLAEVGTFDQDFFAYMEDSDLMIRAKKKGYKFFYDGQVSIYHKVSQTAGLGSIFTDYYLTRNRLIFGFRYLSFRTKFALLRQALRFLLLGRSYQRYGVLDFFSGQKGASPRLLQKPDKVQFSKKLSIVFSNYNTADLAQKLLESIFNKNSGFDPKKMEVIMLDDCSPLDPTPEVKKFFPQIQFLKNSLNQGFTRSYNRLMKLAQGEYILVLNTDMEVLENGIREILQAAERFKGEAVLGGRLFFPDLKPQDSVYHFPTILAVLKEYLFNLQGAFFMYYPKGEKVTKVQGIVGACMLIPQKVIDQVGLLDEAISSYFEDHEYCRRLQKHHIPIYFVPTAKFIHHHGASFKQLGGKGLEIHKQSAIYYYGRTYYTLLFFTLLLVQKLTGKRPPGSMEPSQEKTNLGQKFSNLLKNLSLKQ